MDANDDERTVGNAHPKGLHIGHQEKGQRAQSGTNGGQPPVVKDVIYCRLLSVRRMKRLWNGRVRNGGKGQQQEKHPQRRFGRFFVLAIHFLFHVRRHFLSLVLQCFGRVVGMMWLLLLCR